MLKKSKFFTFLIAALFLGSFTFASCDNAQSDKKTEDTENVESDAIDAEDATDSETDVIENTEKCGEGKCGEGKCGGGDAEDVKPAKEAELTKCGDGKELQEKTTEEMTKGAKKIEGRVGK